MGLRRIRNTATDACKLEQTVEEQWVPSTPLILTDDGEA
jgi:hypothetical protein